MMASILDFDKREVVDAVRAQRQRTLALLEDLSEDQWETEVLPSWRVREVAAHLVTTDESSLKGNVLARRQLPIADVETWNDEEVPRWANRSVPALLHGLDRWGRRLARALALPPASLARRRLPTKFGRVSLMWLGMLRVYDEWVHGEDVRRGLELPADDLADSVRPAARFLFAGIPLQALPEIPEGASGAVALSYTDLDLPPLGIDLGARRFGTSPIDATCSIKGQAATLIMVAAGRDNWDAAERRGTLTIDGDRGPAETFLKAFRVV
jgi:uncharacterized protein (TIGR03083 family)